MEFIYTKRKYKHYYYYYYYYLLLGGDHYLPATSKPVPSRSEVVVNDAGEGDDAHP